MHRRTLLSAFATLPILNIPMIAHAQERMVVQATASPEGARATVLRQGENRFLLEVTDLGFNIGMPPSARFNIGMPPFNSLREFDGGNIIGQEVSLRIGDYTLSLKMDDPGTGNWSWGETSGVLAMEGDARAAGAGFLMPLAGAAAAIGARGLGRGGNGELSVGGTSLGFLLENVG